MNIHEYTHIWIWCYDVTWCYMGMVLAYIQQRREIWECNACASANIYIYARIYTRIYAPISRWMNVCTYIHTYLHVTLVITLRLGNGRPCKLFHGVTTAYVLRVWVGGDSGENKKPIPSPPNIKPPRNHGLVRISYCLDLFGTIQWWGLILMGMGLCYINFRETSVSSIPALNNFAFRAFANSILSLCPCTASCAASMSVGLGVSKRQMSDWISKKCGFNHP